MTLTEMFDAMFFQNAADLYLSAGAPPTLRERHNLVPLTDTPLEPEETEAIAFELMDDNQRSEFTRTGEMNLAYTVLERGRYRVNAFRQKGAVSLVIRLVKFDIPSIEDLTLPPILKELIMRPRGLVLVTGATGSGKSTTLASMIDYRNRTLAGHIITLEDPIEYVHHHQKCVINQREIGLDTLSYEVGMRNVLRQAPDVILVGEIRDRDSMEAVMNYSETGHLVLSTLHSINANQTLERIMQFFPSDIEEKVFQQLSLTMEAVISQRLVPKKDGSGIVPAVEVMIASSRIRELIRKGEIQDMKKTIEASRQDGMQTFDQCLFDLINSGTVTREDGLRAADSPGDLSLKLQGLTSGTANIMG